MENIEKIFPDVRGIKDYVRVKAISVLFKDKRPFDIDEQNDIADFIEETYRKYVFKKKIGLIFVEDGLLAYFFFYKKKTNRR